jgi:NAD(P)-dependent dehydrogenase (short-subunit alcohol dehydrogenase family)
MRAQARAKQTLSGEAMSILKGRVALVTGASSGIGEACALTFAQKGAKVVLAARRAERLEALVDRIAGLRSEALAVTTDVTDETAVQNLFDRAVERFGTVDVVLNNAGIADSTAVDEMPLELWDRVIRTNLTSAFLCSRAAFRVMKGKGRGRIINIGSISARVPRQNSPAYAASKWGLDGLTRSLAIDGREHNIAVSIFHPGIVATEIAPGAVKLADDMSADPMDIAAVIVHMADLPDHLNFYEGLVVQNKLPFLGRG